MSEKSTNVKPLPHHYEVRLAGGPTGYAELSTPGVPGLRTAPPEEFGGPGDAWSPEHLFLGSIQACFLFTIRAVAARSSIEFTQLDLDVTGTVDRMDHVTRFTEIVVHARMTVPLGTDVERAKQILERGKKACLVSASLATPVLLDAQVHEAGIPITHVPHPTL